MILNLVDHDGTDFGTGVRRSERGNGLSGEVFFTGGSQVTAKGDSGIGGAKAEPVAVSGEVTSGVGAEEVNLIALGAEREVVCRERDGVELCFREGEESSSRNDGAIGDAILLRLARIIGEEPAANADIHSRRIEELDGVELGKDRCRKDFIDQDWRNDRRGVIGARRSAKSGAAAPITTFAGSRVGVRVHGHNREAVPIRGDRPGCAVIVGNRQNRASNGRDEAERLAGVVEPAGINAADLDARIPGVELRWISGEHEELSCLK